MKHEFRVISKILLDFFEVTFVAASIFLLLYFFFGQFLQVVGDSMVPTFSDGEQLVAEKFTITFSSLKRGEIAIFEHPNTKDRYLIKRVIGLPGEEMQIFDGKIYIDGELLEESYLANEVITKGGSIIVEDDYFTIPDNMHVFLGDNREKSSDSRDFGPVRNDDIIGRVFFVYYPIQNFRLVKMPDLGGFDLGNAEVPKIPNIEGVLKFFLEIPKKVTETPLLSF